MLVYTFAAVGYLSSATGAETVEEVERKSVRVDIGGRTSGVYKEAVSFASGLTHYSDQLLGGIGVVFIDQSTVYIEKKGVLHNYLFRLFRISYAAFLTMGWIMV